MPRKKKNEKADEKLRFSMTEIARKGFQVVTSTIDKTGIAVVTSHGRDVCVVMPLSVSGMRAFRDRLASETERVKQTGDPDAALVAGLYKEMVDSFVAKAEREQRPN